MYLVRCDSMEREQISCVFEDTSRRDRMKVTRSKMCAACGEKGQFVSEKCLPI